MAKTLNFTAFGKKSSLVYSDFCKIFDYHFDFLSMSERVELYRRCYCVGNGNVTHDVVFSVFNQEGVMLKWAHREFFSKNDFSIVETEKGSESGGSEANHSVE